MSRAARSTASASAAAATGPIKLNTGVRGFVKATVLGMLKSVPGPFKILIVDHEGMLVLNAAMRMNELMDADVTLVENLANPRQPVPSSCAIYFVAPTEKNFEMILADWTARPMYKEAHLFCTTTCRDDLLQRIGSSAARGSFKQAFDLLLDFQAIETLVFSFAQQLDMPMLCSSAGMDPTAANNAATKLWHVFEASNELPTAIRYMDTPVAKAFARSMDEMLKRGKASKGASQLLILDRSVDVIAPLMHELSYQAMLDDLMPLQDGKYMYKGGAKPKPMLIDEEDHIWVKCRHMHIADVMKYTAEALNKLKEENPELVKLQQAKSSGVQVDTTELRDAIRSLPQYQAQQERISLHLDIVSELNRIYRGSGLEVLNEIEQTLATGERSSKEKASAKDLWKDVQAVLKAAGGQYDTATKARMALMYAAVAPEKAKDILAACTAVSDAQVRALDSFNAKDRLAANRKPMGTYSYATMRYDPAVKAIVNGLLEGTLDTKQYPYTDPSAASSVAAATTKAVATTRKGAASRFQSAFTPGAGASAAPAGAGGTLQVGKNETIALTNPARIFVFVVGGMTQSERRAIYELARKCNREIIIGSTSELTPPKYLDGLAGM